MSITKVVTVTSSVKVTIDETKFTPEVLAEFDRQITDFEGDLTEHIKRLGWLHLRREMDTFSFFEGLGPGKDFGLKFEEFPNDEVEISEDRP